MFCPMLRPFRRKWSRQRICPIRRGCRRAAPLSAVIRRLQVDELPPSTPASVGFASHPLSATPSTGGGLGLAHPLPETPAPPGGGGLGGAAAEDIEAGAGAKDGAGNEETNRIPSVCPCTHPL
eukprot:1195404-Prorocentrum_minimum.AAC.1